MVKFQKYGFNQTDLKLADLLCEIHNFYTECFFQISIVQNLDRIRKNNISKLQPNTTVAEGENRQQRRLSRSVFSQRYLPPLMSLKQGLILKIPPVKMYPTWMRTTYPNIVLIQQWKAELQLSDVLPSICLLSSLSLNSLLLLPVPQERKQNDIYSSNILLIVHLSTPLFIICT